MQKSDIICVNETWLESDPDETLTDFHGYFINLKSKGTAVYSKMKPTNVQKIASDHASVIVAGYKTFDIISVYRYSDSSNLEDFKFKFKFKFGKKVNSSWRCQC